MTGQAGAIGVDSVIDRNGISGLQKLIFCFSIVIMMFDGFDTQAAAYVAPVLAAEWKLPPGAFGPVFSAVFLGGMTGSFVFGFAADRIGRKRTLAACMVLFGALNFASGYAKSIETFTLLRFLCGLGLGGVIPNVVALVSEYAPAHRRASLIALTWCGFALGAVFGGLISIPLISNFGWSSVFFVGGAIPILFAPLVMLVIPESVKYLILTRQDGAVASILQKIDPGGQYGAGAVYQLDEAMPGRGSFLALFRNGLAAGSILLCGTLFMSLLLIYCLFNWMPILLREAGLPLKDAVMGGIVFSLSGIPGSFCCTRLIDRKVCHPLVLLIGAYVLSAAAVACIGFAGTSFWPLMTAIFVCGFFVIGAQFSMNAVITNYYPTAIRGTGIGWSQLVGRSGSLVGILVGGALVTWGMTPWQLFQVSGVAPLLGALLLLVFMKVSDRSAMRVTGAVTERVMNEAAG